jgi:hypothetical protein
MASIFPPVRDLQRPPTASLVKARHPIADPVEIIWNHNLVNVVIAHRKDVGSHEHGSGVERRTTSAAQPRRAAAIGRPPFPGDDGQTA